MEIDHRQLAEAISRVLKRLVEKGWVASTIVRPGQLHIEYTEAGQRRMAVLKEIFVDELNVALEPIEFQGVAGSVAAIRGWWWSLFGRSLTIRVAELVFVRFNAFPATRSMTDWFQIIRLELEAFYDIEQRIPEAERHQRGTAAIDAFHDLFLALAAELRIREEWPEAFCHIHAFSTGIIERSPKLEVDFTLGVSLEGWFIEAPIASAHQIRQMRDDYWQHIVRLSTLGKAEFCDYGRPVGWNRSASARKLTQHKCSLVFSIVRDFTLLAAIPDAGFSLGGIRVTFPLESDEPAVRAFFKDALESLYRSNHMLYRAEYLDRRRVLKRYEARSSRESDED